MGSTLQGIPACCSCVDSQSQGGDRSPHQIRSLDAPLGSYWCEEECNCWPPPLTRGELLKCSISKLRSFVQAVGLLTPEGAEKQQLVDWLRSPDAPCNNEDLNDPKVVFTVCDNDESGALDKYELRMALNVLGLYPDDDFIKKCLHGQASVDIAAFASLAEELLSPSTIRSCQRGLRCIPIARRGISLGQLKRLQEVFLDSGWLLKSCEALNAQPAQEVPGHQARHLKEDLYGLNEFLVRDATTPNPKRPVPADLKQEAGLADPAYCCAYAKLINPMGVHVDYFCSHYWGHPLRETMGALDSWAQRAHKDIGKERPEVVTFWICIFALNQHRAEEEVGSSPEDGPFNAALNKASAGAVLILDESTQPFNRIWCLFEVHRLHERGKHLELISDRGPVGRLCKEASPEKKQEAIDYVTVIEEKLSKISAFNAGASSIHDKHAIWHRIVDPWLHRLPLSVILSEGLFENPDAFTEFDSSVGALLATSLLEASLHVGCSSAARYLGQGAVFTRRHLECASKLGIDPLSLRVGLPDDSGPEGAGWMPLLHSAARFGHLEGVTALLERAANVEDRDSSQRTAMHLAARGGRADVAKLLCMKGAELEVTDQPYIWTPLHYAALSGHLSVVNMLLSCKANTEASTSGGWTPLFCAAAYGKTEVVEALLSSEADANAKAHDGQTPLHWSAARGHQEVSRVLIAQSASLETQDEEGTSPLNRAERGGHLEVQALLCKTSRTASCRLQSCRVGSTSTLDRLVVARK